MEKITTYRTNDGEVFFDEKEAVSHEGLISKIDGLEKRYLNPLPESFSWPDFINQDILKVLELERDFKEAFLESKQFAWVKDWRDVDSIGFWLIGRALSDASSEKSRPFDRLYERILSIHDWKEYTQPYYAQQAGSK